MAENHDDGRSTNILGELIRSGAVPVRSMGEEYGGGVLTEGIKADQLADAKASGAADWTNERPSHGSAPAVCPGPVTPPAPPTPDVCFAVGGTATTTPSGERITPLEDRVVVEVDEADSITKGGIILPDVAKERPMRGTVVAVGPGRRTELTGVLIPMILTVGNRVLFARYTGELVKSGETDYRIIREREISAVLG